ncbi:DUF5958 family protein [Streptomyces sp. NPDC015171]|uniref:DUF5958 family protein n=1 Tax=Streptomyces sp. NPDC015171 TaxID=3364945 RepID=UPI0036FC85B2
MARPFHLEGPLAELGAPDLVLYAHTVILNELAQRLRSTAEGVEWLEGLPEDDRRKVLHALVLFCGQARARQEDVPESIARSGIRPTHTPAPRSTDGRHHRWARMHLSRRQSATTAGEPAA